ncbi:MAG: gamma-glutamyltransferase [Acidobacteria bacterium]|nr:MAG: gamma-glutamyltransferase [Acidobacteriota bacterium]
MNVIAGRSKIATTYGIVAASQPLAARAGVQVLEHGGNAVDAAIATNAVMALVEPYFDGIGGDLFVMYYEAKTGKLHGLNAGGWAPSGLSAALLKAKGMERMPQKGIYSVTVPGAVAGWDTMRAKFGKLPMSDLMAPAIYYAENGFPVSEVIADAWGRATDGLAAEPYAAKAFLVNGRAPKAGEVFRNPDLGGSFRLIAEKGRAGFYEGRTAEAILAISREKGGTMTAADLREYIYTVTVPGAVAGWDALRSKFGKLPMSDLMAPAIFYAENGFPVSEVIADAWARAKDGLAAEPYPAKAACNVEPSVFDGLTNSPGGDTIYLSVIDRDGNIVSLIQSLYGSFGSGLVAPGTGIMLHNRGGLFTLDEKHPNALAPRKRPLHTIIPAFMQKGDVRIGFGIMGGFNQAQAHAQFVADIADFGLDIQQALEAGRFTKGSFAGCDVQIEALVPDKVRSELKALGHDVRVVPPRSGTFGYGQAVMSDGAGVHFGASEPRHDGAAIPEAPPIFGRGR